MYFSRWGHLSSAGLDEKLSCFIALSPAVLSGPLTQGFLSFTLLSRMDWDTWKSVFGKRIAVSFFICTEHNAVQAYWTLYPHAVIIQLCASYNFRNYGIQCLHFFLIGSGCSGARQRWSGSHHSCQVHHHTWLLCKSQRWTLFSSFTVLQASSGAVRADLRIVSAQWRRRFYGGSTRVFHRYSFMAGATVLCS